MSEIKKLIERLCPDGVEYKKLGELEIMQLIQLGRGNVISKKDIRDYPGEYPVYSSSSVGDGEIGRYGKYMFDDERISWSIDGGGKFFYRNNIKYSITNVSGWLKVLAPQTINTKYLYYSLMNEWSHKVYDYIHKAHPSVIREEYEIPVPPIEVQSKIVEILDNYTELESELEAQLESELEARQKQYEYYRNQLLTFDEAEGARFDVKWMTLGDIFIMKAGKNISAKNIFDSESPQHQYPCFGGNGIRGYVSECNEHGAFPIIGRQGALCGNIQMAKGDFYATEHAVVVKPRIKEVDIRWAYHKLIHMNINQYKTKSAQPGLAVSRIESLEICLPPLSEQQRIVSILDRFENTIENNY